MPVAETFAFLDTQGFSLSELARLDTMVTVVNGETFQDLLCSPASVAGEHTKDGGPRKLSDLLVEQVEYANVILVSHLDVIGEERFAELRSILSSLNPTADILPMSHGKIKPRAILDTRKFDLPSLVQSPGWMRQMGTEERPAESDTYGISSWVYRERAPFHPGRLHDFLNRTWSNGRLLRCKGYIWMANRYADTGMLVQTAGKFKWGYVGRWWRFRAASDWPQDDYRRQGILEKWAPHAGDCRQEIVFIGQAVDWAMLKERLDYCLLSVEEIEAGPDSWESLAGASAFEAEVAA
jgi:G3E family GTPase